MIRESPKLYCGFQQSQQPTTNGDYLVTVRRSTAKVDSRRIGTNSLCEKNHLLFKEDLTTYSVKFWSALVSY